MQTDTTYSEIANTDTATATAPTSITTPSTPTLNALCAPAPLALALRYVKPTVASRTTLPALKCVLLNAQVTNDAANGQLVVTTSNLNATTSSWLAAHVTTPGSIAVPYATFSELVNRLPQNATLHLEMDSATQTLRVQCDDIVTNIKGVPSHEFPQPSAWDTGAQIELGGKEFKNIVRQVAYAAASDDSRPVLTGVLFEMGANGLAFAAADGFRLSLRAQATPTGMQETLRVIVPAQVLGDVEKIIADDMTLTVAINSNKSHIQFTMPNYRLIASLLDGNFPNVQSIVPTTHATRVVVDTGTLGSSVDLAMIFAQQAKNLVVLEAEPGAKESAGTLRLVAASAESGDTRRALPVSITGDAQKLALNGKFIKEFVESVNAPQIAIQFNNAASPVVFSEVGNPNYTHILMPMHLSSK